MSDTPLADALRKAAEVVADYVRRASPGSRIAGTWRISQRSDGSIHIITSDIAAYMTDGGYRHPVYGRGDDRRKWGWAAENKNHPGRTGWAGRATDEALDEAIDQMADEYADSIAVEIK
jgi:hypothetical protein